MPMVDLAERVESLERRMSELEGPVGFIIPTMRQIHMDLLNFKEQTNQHFDRIEGRLTKVEGRLEKVEGRLENVETKLDSLVETLRGMMRDVMREVLSEDRKSRR